MIAISPESNSGSASESTVSSAIETASPFRVSISTIEPALVPAEALTIPGLARVAPCDKAAAAPSFMTTLGR